MSKGDNTPAPDFMGLADRMGNWNLGAINQQTLANRPNQRTPFGSTSWTQTPGGWSPDLGTEHHGMGAGGGQGGGQGGGLGPLGIGIGGGLGGGWGGGGIGGTGGGVGPGGMPPSGTGTLGGGLGLLGGGTSTGGGGLGPLGIGIGGGLGGGWGGNPVQHFGANQLGGTDTDPGGGVGLSGGDEDQSGGPGNGGGFVGPGGPGQGGTDGGYGGPANQWGGLDDGGGTNGGGGGSLDSPPKGGGGPAFGGGPTQGGGSGTGAGSGGGAQTTGGFQDPWGTGGSQWNPPPGADGAGMPGQWTQETTLNPVAQRSLDAQMDLQRQRSQFGQSSFGRVRDALGRPVDFGGMPSLNPLGANALGDLGNGMDARNAAEGALYKRATSRLDPQWGQREDQLRTRLANQGLDPSSQAYQTEMGNFQRGENDAYDQARQAAIAGGGQEQNLQYGMNLGANQQKLAAQGQGFGQSAQARQQGIAELLQRRELPMQEMQALLSGQSVQSPQFPSFMGAGAAQSPNYLGAGQAQGNYNLQNQGMQNQMYGDIGSGVGGMLPFLAMLSDERAKINIRRLPLEIVHGIPLAVFEYRHEPGREYVGVIAQDVERARPDAVTEICGLKHVYYGKLTEGTWMA